MQFRKFVQKCMATSIATVAAGTFLTTSAMAKDYFVATNGNDSNAGTIEAPFKTIKKAGEKAGAGDVVFVRGGTYKTDRFLIQGNSGAAGAPITYKNYNGEQVIVDGSGMNLSFTDGLVRIYQLKHIVVDGFTLQNSAGRAVHIYESENVVVKNMKVNGTQNRAIGGSGENVTIENNEVMNAGKVNENRKMCGQTSCSGGWPGIVQMGKWDTQTGRDSKNIKILNNKIHDSWGEGILLGGVIGVEITGNTVYNTFSVGIYLDKVKDAKVTNNTIYQTDVKYNRPDRSYGLNAISVANENEDTIGTPTENVTISNNTIYDVGHAFTFWLDKANGSKNNSYRNIVISDNLIMNTGSKPIKVDAVESWRENPSGKFINNIVIGSWTEQTGLELAQPEKWTITGNTFAPKGDWRFLDVPPTHKFFAYIENLAAAGVVNGYPGDIFKPNELTTRGMLAKIVTKGMGLAEKHDCPQFVDVKTDNKFYGEIWTLKCHGVVRGFDDNTFRSENQVSRAETTKFVVEAARVKKGNPNFLPNTSDKQFPDVPTNMNLAPWIYAAYSNGIVVGKEGGAIFDPNGKATRAEISAIVDKTRAKL